MGKVMIEIKDTKNVYDLDKVDCFERPTAIILESIDKDYSGYYLMFRKLFQVYSPDAGKSYYSELTKNIGNTIFDKLGITCVNETVPDLRKALIERIDAQTPVLIPGNLMELYYSMYYKNRNWPHSFLIRGYDSENDLFHILDYTQITASDVKRPYVAYEPFVMRGRDLEAVYNGFAFFDPNPFITYLVKRDGSVPLDKKELLLAFLRLLNQKMDDNVFFEESISAEIIALVKNHTAADSETIDELLHLLNKSPKRKDAMISEMLHLLKNYALPDDVYLKMERLRTDILQTWTVIIGKFYKNFLKRVYESLDLTEVIQLERNLYDLARLSLSGLPKTSSNDALFCENNDDQIIEILGERVAFSFANKTYNSFIRDDCPKVIFKDPAVNGNFIFSTRAVVPRDNVEEGFLAGIFIRYKNGTLFFWGIDNDECLVFDFAGKGNLYRKYDDRSDHTFVIQAVDQVLYYGVAEDNVTTILGSRNFSEGIAEVGLACKTWEDCKGIKVVFEEFALKRYHHA